MANDYGFGNPFDMRRFGNIFGGQPAQRQSLVHRGPEESIIDTIRRVSPTAPTQPAMTQDPLMQALSRLNGGQATNAYREHVGKLPNQEDYQPSGLRRLGSALTAAASAWGGNPNAMELGAHMRDAPFRGALEQWQMRGAGLKEQADIEQQDVKGQISHMQAIRQLQKDEADAENQRSTAATARFTALSQNALREAQINKLENEGWVKHVDENGYVTMFVPGTNKRQPMGPSIDTRHLNNKDIELADQLNRTGILAGGLDVQRGNLANNQARTGIMQQNANTAKSRVGSASFVAPSAQRDAETNAIKEVVQQNPGFANSDWVDLETYTLLNPDIATLNDPKYRRFQAAIAAAKNRIINMQRGGMGDVGDVMSFDDLED